MKPALLLLVALALAPACTLAEVDATVDEVCLTYPNLAVPAAPAASAALAQHFEFDNLGPVHQLLDLDAQLKFVRAEVRTSATGALAGIDRASVDLAGADLPRAMIYACDGDCAGSGATLDLPADTATSALAYLSASSLAVDLSASGALPAHAWTMDVDVCLSGHARYTVAP